MGATFKSRRLLIVAGFLALVLMLSAGIWRLAFVAGLDELERRAKSDLALAADGLNGALERYREIAVLLADHPQLRPVLQRGAPVDEARALLRRIADKTGSLDIADIDALGVERVSAQSTVEISLSGSPVFERAMDGALGVGHRYADRYRKRAFVFGAPIFSAQGPVDGVVVVTANAEAIEASWRGDRPALFFTDQSGVVFLSNRSELVFRTREGSVPDTGLYPADKMTPFIGVTQTPVAGKDLWDVDGGRYLPRQALHHTLPMPSIDMVGEVLIDVAPARQSAFQQATVAAALCLAFGAMLFLATERRRALAEANADLEARVADRTSDLERLNTDLRREVVTRSAAESELKRAQAELVQAGKLSALGQMSAGISHELNQPLMAIRSFAENAQAFLERDKPEIAGENLGRISELARRMGRIIQNLRAFARQESAPLTDVDLVAVMEAVLEISAAKARQAGADLVWQAPDRAIMVHAGEVRLQQVLMNLVANAIDAMDGRAEKRVEVTVAVDERVAVEIRDTGPGIAEPEKIFDPFYSTKSVGDTEGMGLGLSISYGLVQSFGGDIRGRNHPEGGAIFTIELDRARTEVAA